MELLLKDSPNKGHHGNYLLTRVDNLSTVDKLAGSNVSFITLLHCKHSHVKRYVVPILMLILCIE